MSKKVECRGVKVVARNMRLLREIRGLTQTELARRLGVRNSYICDLEKCRTNISVKALERIAKVLEVPLKLFFEEDLLSLPLSAFEPYPYDEVRRKEIEEERRKAKEQLEKDLERFKTALRILMGVHESEDPYSRR